MVHFTTANCLIRFSLFSLKKICHTWIPGIVLEKWCIAFLQPIFMIKNGTTGVVLQLHQSFQYYLQWIVFTESVMKDIFRPTGSTDTPLLWDVSGKENQPQKMESNHLGFASTQNSHSLFWALEKRDSRIQLSWFTSQGFFKVGLKATPCSRTTNIA